MSDLLSSSKNGYDDNSKSDSSSALGATERQPLLSFFKGAATKKSPTKKQQKDKSPAAVVPAPLHSRSSTTDDAIDIEDTDRYSPLYGSIGESSSRPHQSQQQQQQQQDQDGRQQRHPTTMRIYIVLTLFLGTIFVASLVLLLLAPRFAQKHFEDGVQLQFQQASIVNATTTSDGVNVITMNIVGSITLLGTAYNLSRHVARVFGDIQLLDTTLQVFQAPPPTATWTPSAPAVSPYQPSSSPAIYQSFLGTIKLPGLTLSSASNVTLIDFVTQFVVEDPTGLMNFCKDALTSKQVGWQVVGTLPLHVGWLPMENSLALNKVINIDGMDGLKQTELNNMVFPGTHPLGGILLEGTVGIYNPSKTLSITIGDVDFGIFLPGGENGEDEMVAVVRAMDTELLGQRMNYFNVKGRTLPLNDDETNKRQLMEQFLTRYLHGNASIVHVRGSTFGPDDDDNYAESQLQRPSPKSTSKVPDWLQKALASMTLAVPFPGATQMDIIQSLTMDNIKIDFSMVTKDPLVSCDTTALLQLPKEMKFELDVVEIDPVVYIYLEHDSKDPFAVLHPNHPCPSRTIHRGQGDDTIPKDMFMVKSKINKAPFKVLSGHEDEFEKFLDRVLNKRNSTVYLQGTANALVSSEFGRLMVRDLTFKGQINTIGMQGMKCPPPKVIDLAIVKGHSGALQVKTKLIVTNPSNVDINLGAITFTMAYQSEEIGNVTIRQLNLIHGSSSTFESDGYIYATSDGDTQNSMTYNDMDQNTQPSPMVTFIGDYISGKPIELAITGRKDSTTSPFLAPLLQQLAFLIQVPAFEEPPLLQHVQMNLLSSTALVWLRNPFPDIHMEIININASATYQQDKEVGTMYANFTDGGKGWEGPVSLPPVDCQRESDNMEGLGGSARLDFDQHGDQETGCTGIVVETPRIPVMMKKIGLDTISKALGGRIELAIDSLVTVAIDSFVLQDLHYKRDNLTAIVKKSF